MDIEYKINHLGNAANLRNPDEFLRNFHLNRIEKEQQILKRRSGFASLLIILVILFTGFQQMKPQQEMEIPSTFQETFTSEDLDEFAAYLIDESSDLQSTLEILWDVDYEPVTQIIKGES